MLNLKVDGAKLRTLREEAGMSVADLAKKASCSRWNIYRIEQGGQPSPEVYGRIRAALGIKGAELLTNAENAA